MNFREYYELNEDRNYILMRDRNGQYHVLGNFSDKQLPQAMQSAKEANKPVGIWSYSTEGGKLQLPPELASEKEPILHAHFARFGLDKPAISEPNLDDESEFIDPSVFNPNYGKSGAWKKYTEPGTVDYVGHSLPRGMPTPPPKRPK